MPADYNSTLNLPKTEFSMKAGLPDKEPLNQAHYESIDLYNKIIAQNSGKPKFILHYGPPYANGDIHIGTALNNILKDFVVRYKNISGYQSPLVPGWDCHGLPIELKARKAAGLGEHANISAVELRKICKEFALGYVDNQREQFKRLGVLARWDNPYLTLKPEFEAEQVKIFGEMALNGYLYKGLKPVHWCPKCATALAEAEIEHDEDVCFSIYVKFEVNDDKGLLTKIGCDLANTYFVIWTTTTWTLPGNVAICLGADFEYSVVKTAGQYLIIAKDLVDKVMQTAKIETYETVGTFTGAELENMTAKHPFLDRQSLIINGDHVTLESGTGCVHTAPGHGVEDFEVCKHYDQLEIVVPVDDKGNLNELAGEFAGLSTSAAGKIIAEAIDKTGHLMHTQKINHQYPHCWRCNSPVIFRATEQWFCSVSAIKDKALEAVKNVNWYPGWGEERMTSMIRDRSDWCVSRQRIWGVPIPIFYCTNCKKPLVTNESINAVSEAFRAEGSDCWYIKSAEELIGTGNKCECGCTNFEKETDIMDVWFDSGSSHMAVCEQDSELTRPADLYLEGGDQYRGWFQSSLLTSIACGKESPYKSVITHGWVVDDGGNKQSKSKGNGTKPSEIIEQYGADILRLWVASSDYHTDIRISKDILKQLSEVYRKIRNTSRFILGCINDFDPNTNAVTADKYSDIDIWLLNRLNEVITTVKAAYEKYEFHTIFHVIHNFCVIDLSNFYLDVNKDRLYVEQTNSITRRAAQTVIYKVLNALTRMISPILAFTSDEVWQAMPHTVDDNTEHVMLNQFPECEAITVDEAFKARWEKIKQLRDDVKKALEIARTNKVIGSALEAKLTIYVAGEWLDFAKNMNEYLAELFIVSTVEVSETGKGEFTFDLPMSFDVSKADGQKCERCWMYSQSVGKDTGHATICKRCISVIS